MGRVLIWFWGIMESVLVEINLQYTSCMCLLERRYKGFNGGFE